MHTRVTSAHFLRVCVLPLHNDNKYPRAAFGGVCCARKLYVWVSHGEHGGDGECTSLHTYAVALHANAVAATANPSAGAHELAAAATTEAEVENTKHASDARSFIHNVDVRLSRPLAFECRGGDTKRSVAVCRLNGKWFVLAFRAFTGTISAIDRISVCPAARRLIFMIS